LSLSPDAFRNELYASTVAASLDDLTFTSVISHHVELKPLGQKLEDDAAGSDAALEALKSSLASFEQEKQANQSNIVQSILPATSGRHQAKRHKRSLLGPVPLPSPALSAAATPRLGPSQTSEPLNDAEVRLRALRTPIIHLLAIRPASTASIVSKTHIPKEDIENILQKIARKENGHWKLIDRAYKELDIWKFGYSSKDERQAATDNAIRAYDRLRIGKEEKIWQLLLPKEDRGKGIILSRLGASHANRGLTPNHTGSPLLHPEGDEKAASTMNTPRLGGSAPRPGSSKADVTKRLLSKDPKKRALEEAKEKKRKEREAAREAAASERQVAKPAKRAVAKKPNPKVKSAEIVHSSDDESGEEGEVKEEIKRADSKVEPRKPEVPKGKTSSGIASSPDSSDNAAKRSAKAAAKHTPDPAKSIAALASKAAKSGVAGKTTPKPVNGLSALSSQQRAQRSPSKTDSRPNVPSPLGAARPRVASDMSDRTALGVQRLKQGAGTPLGLGISNGARKRQDTVTSTTSSGSDRKRHETNGEKQQKPLTNGISKPKVPASNGVSHTSEGGMKRKAEDLPAMMANGGPVTKHRKTESTSSSSQSQKSRASSTAPAQNTAHTSPEASFDGGGGSSSDSAASVLDTITFTQGVNLAEKFRDVYYPAYARLYDAQAAKDAKGEVVSPDERDHLLAMHRRLQQMKREIEVASQRDYASPKNG
jgi:RNA polymerase II elongation factor ELL